MPVHLNEVICVKAISFSTAFWAPAAKMLMNGLVCLETSMQRRPMAHRVVRDSIEAVAVRCAGKRIPFYKDELLRDMFAGS